VLSADHLSLLSLRRHIIQRPGTPSCVLVLQRGVRQDAGRPILFYPDFCSLSRPVSCTQFSGVQIPGPNLANWVRYRYFLLYKKILHHRFHRFNLSTHQWTSTVPLMWRRTRLGLVIRAIALQIDDLAHSFVRPVFSWCNDSILPNENYARLHPCSCDVCLGRPYC
jgi:hypothetical protein